ncbi:MAG: DUF308 domain-containing protein, partial [Xanthobacteraceae bacterium]
MILGVAAVAWSIAATIVSMLFFGWLLVIASGIEVAQSVMVGRPGRAGSKSGHVR